MHKFFISHKHEDQPIADAVSWLIEKHAAGKVEIFQSSNYAYSGPKSSGFLNNALISWLSQTEAFLLIYTSDEQDWSYCMYEYGVVSHPSTVENNCFVLQCTTDKPKVLEGHIMIKANEFGSVAGFVRDFFRGTPFPSQVDPFCPWTDKVLHEVAKKFFDRLQLAIKFRQRTQWTNWPQIQVCIALKDIKKLNDGKKIVSSSSRVDYLYSLLQHKAVLKSVDNCSEIFHYIGTEKSVPFRNLIDSWQDEMDESSEPWLRDIAFQIVRILERKVGTPSRAPIVSCTDRRRRQMIVSQATKDEASSQYEFQVLFIDLNDPKSVFIGDIMIPIDQAPYRILYGHDEKQMYLVSLLEDMKNNQQKRMLLLWKDGTPAYIVEPEDMYTYLIKASGQTNTDLSQISMDDMLKDKESDAKLRRSFAVVSPNSSLTEARKAMEEIDPNCRSAVVTTDGKLGNKALGFFTDNTTRSA